MRGIFSYRDRALLGQFQGPHARPRIVQKWNDLATDLNKLGKTNVRHPLNGTRYCNPMQ